MASPLTAPPEVYRLETFAQRLTFARVFIAGVKSERKMARLLGYKESTYATWENGSMPQDRFEVASRFEELFPAVSAVWLLRGGSQIWSELTGVEMPDGQLELALDASPPQMQAI